MADEDVDFAKDATGVFVPTDEWKRVEPGRLELCLICIRFCYIIDF